ncbi:MAG: threonine synthase [Chitinophagaceae bacterium]|nr:MAG: threonine synthase [Chitinophagaceae bacterium]
MQYYSTSHHSPNVDFREAAIKGQAPDKGLYFPQSIPQIDPSLLRDIESTDDADIAFQVIRPFVGNSIPDEVLFSIAKESISFPIPLVDLGNGYHSLELFHGPTLAFKDVGARFMSRCLGYFLKENTKKVTVLVATSGDTGGAVANGFFGVEGVEVVILYPSGKVSPVQEKQLTTLGGNIRALEIDGSFDDCQAMVKQAFMDPQLNDSLFLTSANSINVARWLPQQFYYLLAYKQWKDKSNPPVISVPSGNFGNICAGLMAHAGGLPVRHFLAACNVNDVVTRYLATEKYEPLKAIATLSNAMDVGEPSNFIRIQEIFGHRFNDLAATLSSYTVTDAETLDTISQVETVYHYTPDPHGAVAFHALEVYRRQFPDAAGIFLETAHPVKFPDAIEQATGRQVPVPESLTGVMSAQKKSTLLKPSFDELKQFLLA